MDFVHNFNNLFCSLFQKLLPQAAPVHGVRAAVDEPAGGAEEVRQECRTPHQSC